MSRRIRFAIALALAGVAAAADLANTTPPSTDHPAIEYFNYLNRPPSDVVAALNRKLEAGQAQLRFQSGTGYLRSVLEALSVPIRSQIVVFSKTSLQAPWIEPRNPRTIFFNDNVAVAWVRGGFIELAAHDPRQGVIFYSLEQSPANPRFQRRDDCLRCHISDVSLGVPGMMVRSRYTAPDGMPRLIYGGFTTDHRSPWEERWGGWYVTGHAAGIHHLGNAMVEEANGPEAIAARTVELPSLAFQFDISGYLSPYSDIVALLVFNHQMHMINLITRVGWDARAAMHDHRDAPSRIRDGVAELVDYLLFVDEAPLSGRVRGASGFEEGFAAEGPRDGQGRSLRQFDLEHRIFRYPCSYMIYSNAFEALPADVRTAVYRRMWEILSGQEQGTKYARLSLADRRAIIEILRATKTDIPPYFR
jgi:hypothetical protein